MLFMAVDEQEISEPTLALDRRAMLKAAACAGISAAAPIDMAGLTDMPPALPTASQAPMTTSVTAESSLRYWHRGLYDQRARGHKRSGHESALNHFVFERMKDYPDSIKVFFFNQISRHFLIRALSGNIDSQPSPVDARDHQVRGKYSDSYLADSMDGLEQLLARISSSGVNLKSDPEAFKEWLINDMKKEAEGGKTVWGQSFINSVADSFMKVAIPTKEELEQIQSGLPDVWRSFYDYVFNERGDELQETVVTKKIESLEATRFISYREEDKDTGKVRWPSREEPPTDEALAQANQLRDSKPGDEIRRSLGVDFSFSGCLQAGSVRFESLTEAMNCLPENLFAEYLAYHTSCGLNSIRDKVQTISRVSNMKDAADSAQAIWEVAVGGERGTSRREMFRPSVAQQNAGELSQRLRAWFGEGDHTPLTITQDGAVVRIEMAEEASPEETLAVETAIENFMQTREKETVSAAGEDWSSRTAREAKPAFRV